MSLLNTYLLTKSADPPSDWGYGPEVSIRGSGFQV